METLYRPVDARVSFPDLERRVAEGWGRASIYQKSLTAREGYPEWVFYEGPPTANGKPGIHHVEPRVFKDLFCRFKTMTGHYVYRKAGWDCHGLGVEIAVEKELGITAKREIEERVGVERFTDRCRESVKRYVDDWEVFTSRVGFWLDLQDPYWTMSPGYIESVWWLLKQIWDKGLLEEDFKVVPYCPRCETALSSHELGQPDVYFQVEDPSVYVRFPLPDEPGVALLAWTTTPWTLLANMAAAVGPDIDYVRAADPALPGGELILAAERAGAVLGPGAAVSATMKGADLAGIRYLPPFGFVEPGEHGHTVRLGDFVTTEDGSGIVHLAPYGEEDMVIAKRDHLPIEQMVDASGRVAANGAQFSGLWVKDADPVIIEDLRARDLLLRAEGYVHSYPHCWRCKTPLLYYPRRDWYVRTSRLRSELQASNEEVTWQPPTIKHGRFGDWLANNVDWSLSRDRYWGTPLPIWRCSEGHDTCVGSFTELGDLARRDLTGFDPHRPHVDAITFDCPRCGARATRAKSVIDAWFDSGAMPFAQWHFPFENKEVFEKRFPAQFISEAIDQTRGWFYSLLAIATLVEGKSAYQNVVCLGHIVDASGRKMSKSLGNVIEPFSVLDEHGADALRWFMITSGSPWAPRRTSGATIQDTLRKYLLTLWNTYSFWVTYASVEGFLPGSPPAGRRPELDRWVLAELDDTVRAVTLGLEDFDATSSGRRIERFVDDLSNWYVRRSRRRFWGSGKNADTQMAFHTLWECLVTVAQLSAPFTPFVAEEIFTNLTRPLHDAPESVHLSDWPQARDERRDDDLRERMVLARRLVTLGRSARTDANLRTRQPLARALVVAPRSGAERLAGLERIVAEELNVKRVEVAHGLEELVTYSVRPNFKALGPRLGARVQSAAAALRDTDAAAVVASLERDGSYRLDIGGDTVSLAPDDLDVRVEGRAGFSLAQDGPYGVALDLELSGGLVAEGIARETVRAVQDLRKVSGLAVQDRIHLWLTSNEQEVARALRVRRDDIAAEVLATQLHLGEHAPGHALEASADVGRGTVTMALAVVD